MVSSTSQFTVFHRARRTNIWSTTVASINKHEGAPASIILQKWMNEYTISSLFFSHNFFSVTLLNRLLKTNIVKWEKKTRRLLNSPLQRFPSDECSLNGFSFLKRSQREIWCGPLTPGKHMYLHLSHNTLALAYFSAKTIDFAYWLQASP